MSCAVRASFRMVKSPGCVVDAGPASPFRPLQNEHTHLEHSTSRRWLHAQIPQATPQYRPRSSRPLCGRVAVVALVSVARVPCRGEIDDRDGQNERTTPSLGAFRAARIRRLSKVISRNLRPRIHLRLHFGPGTQCLACPDRPAWVVRRSPFVKPEAGRVGRHRGDIVPLAARLR